jgi:hypothetical protein
MQQLKISLPDETRAALDAASAQSGKSLADEIRARLAWSFEQDAVDKPTRDLQADIAGLAEQLSRDKRFSWYAHDKARQTFIEAVKDWITNLKPTRRWPLLKPETPGATALMWGDDDPATLGRAIARHYARFKAAIEASEEEMRRLHNIRGTNNE